MSRIKSMLTLAAVSAVTATSAPGIAGAVPSAGSGLPWGSIPKPDRIAAERAAHNMSAPLDRFALIHVRTIPPTATSVVSNNSDPEGFQFGDAAIGAGVMAGLVSLVTATAITFRRRANVRHP